MDRIVQIEVLLNLLNTLLGKAVYYRDQKTTNALSTLRHSIYYGEDFDYESLLKQLKSVGDKLKTYE